MRKGGPVGPPFLRNGEELDLLNVGGLGALLALGDFEAHALVLIQGAEAAALNGSVVDEEISTALVGGDESETLFGVEPLDGALSHDDYLLFFVLDTDALSLPGEVAMLFCARPTDGQTQV